MGKSATNRASQSGKTTKPRVDSAGHMNDALLEKCGELRRLYREALESDIEKRYAFAVSCHDVCEGAEYGSNAVNQAAKHLGLDPSTIRDYAAVVRVWSTKEKFLEEASKPDKFEKPLSWSHFIEVAQIEDGRVRRSLLSKARNNGWTVRDLQKAIREKDDEESSMPAESVETSEEQPAASSELVDTTDQLTHLVVEKLPDQVGAATATDVALTLERLKLVRKQLDLQIRQLEKQLKVESSDDVDAT